MVGRRVRYSFNIILCRCIYYCWYFCCNSVNYNYFALRSIKILSFIDFVYTDTLQLHFTPYILDSACILVDPKSSAKNKRKAIILNLGFHVPFEDRLGIVIQGDTSPNLFFYYYEQVRQLFEYASKIILVAEATQTDKTSVIQKLLGNLSLESRSHCFSIISHSIRKGNRHVGYEVL